MFIELLGYVSLVFNKFVIHSAVMASDIFLPLSLQQGLQSPLKDIAQLTDAF